MQTTALGGKIRIMDGDVHLPPKSLPTPPWRNVFVVAINAFCKAPFCIVHSPARTCHRPKNETLLPSFSLCLYHLSFISLELMSTPSDQFTPGTFFLFSRFVNRSAISISPIVFQFSSFWSWPEAEAFWLWSSPTMKVSPTKIIYTYVVNSGIFCGTGTSYS